MVDFFVLCQACRFWLAIHVHVHNDVVPVRTDHNYMYTCMGDKHYMYMYMQCTCISTCTHAHDVFRCWVGPTCGCH